MKPSENSSQVNQSPSRCELTKAMQEFCRQIPSSVGLAPSAGWDYLYYFEAERLLTMRQALLDAGFTSETPIRVLDFGYLHGLVPEFLHRFFPRSRFTVLDHPESPNFRNPEYMALVQSRSYLVLKPCSIEQIPTESGPYDLIILGEIIEHLDPTVAARAFGNLRKLVAEKGCLLITSPNGGSIRDTLLTLIGHDTQSAPIPDATMGYPHIHLWSHPILKRTLAHFGWRSERVYYTNGKDGQDFAESNRSWGGWKRQLLAKSFFFAAQLRHRWRGFMVSTWKPVALPSNQL